MKQEFAMNQMFMDKYSSLPSEHNPEFAEWQQGLKDRHQQLIDGIRFAEIMLEVTTEQLRRMQSKAQEL